MAREVAGADATTEWRGATLWTRDPTRSEDEWVQLIRMHPPEILLLAVAHHVVDVLPGTGIDEGEWLEEVARGGPAYAALHRTWQGEEVPAVSAVAALTARLVGDDAGEPRILSGFTWAATCWQALGARSLTAAENVLA